MLIRNWNNRGGIFPRTNFPVCHRHDESDPGHPYDCQIADGQLPVIHFLVLPSSPGLRFLPSFP